MSEEALRMSQERKEGAGALGELPRPPQSLLREAKTPEGDALCATKPRGQAGTPSNGAAEQ